MKRTVRILGCLLLCAASVYADTQPEVLVGAQLLKQGVTSCIREHEVATADTSATKKLLERAHQQVQQSMAIDADRLARIKMFTVLKQYQDKLDKLPHTAAVCAAQSELKSSISQIRKDLYNQLLLPLAQQQVAIEERFTRIKDTNDLVAYKSYSVLLDLLDMLYTTVGQLKKIDTPALQPILEKDIQTMRASLIDQEKRLLTYAFNLFETEYPRRVTELKQLMMQWLNDIEGSAVVQKEQRMLQKEKELAVLLGRANKNEQTLSCAQIPLVRRQFITSPCWQKFKTKLQGQPDTDTDGVTIVVRQGDRGQENYVVVP